MGFIVGHSAATAAAAAAAAAAADAAAAAAAAATAAAAAAVAAHRVGDVDSRGGMGVPSFRTVVSHACFGRKHQTLGRNPNGWCALPLDKSEPPLRPSSSWWVVLVVLTDTMILHTGVPVLPLATTGVPNPRELPWRNSHGNSRARRELPWSTGLPVDPREFPQKIFHDVAAAIGDGGPRRPGRPLPTLHHLHDMPALYLVL